MTFSTFMTNIVDDNFDSEPPDAGSMDLLSRSLVQDAEDEARRDSSMFDMYSFMEVGAAGGGLFSPAPGAIRAYPQMGDGLGDDYGSMYGDPMSEADMFGLGMDDFAAPDSLSYDEEDDTQDVIRNLLRSI